MEGAVQLTADLVARAVIAAASSYGDDPVKAMTARRGPLRRCVTAAAEGLVRATEQPNRTVARVIGVSEKNLGRKDRAPGFDLAVIAAMRAVEFALAEQEPEDEAEAEDLKEAVAAEPEPPIVVGPIYRPPIAEPARSRPEGQALARIRPPPPPPLALPEAERPVRDLVLEALRAAGRPLDSMNLATAVGRKESPVIQALGQLEFEDLVVSEPVADGPRRFKWRLVEAAAFDQAVGG